MPHIHLKPNSPDYADEGRSRPGVRHCDMPGCGAAAEHRAPKNRGLDEHYWFCLPHVQEYNKSWDFFAGMAPSEIEDHIVRSFLWDRPTRRFDGYAKLEEQLQTKAWQSYNYTDQEPPKPRQAGHVGIDRNTPEFKAMALMELEAPLTIETLKTRYKTLAKKYHPDLNGGDPAAEELLKSVNMAYTVLKLSFEKFEQLSERQ